MNWFISSLLPYSYFISEKFMCYKNSHYYYSINPKSGKQVELKLRHENKYASIITWN